jgi:heme-degrading monooxygenase HmoA
MYTIVERRKVNPERLQETLERAQSEFFPHLQQAPGFISFYVVADDANGMNVAIIVWESKAQADTFEAGYSGWMQKLEEFGHTLQTENRGETVITIEPQR